MTPEHPDPLLAALTELTGPRPAAALDARVRARCHAAMRSAAGQPPARTRAIDQLLPLVLAVYASAVVLEALRVFSGLN
jgi:hypothetical protein